MPRVDRHWRPAATIAAAALLALVGSAPASAASPFAALNGSWSGSGQFRLENGRSESMRCSANYASRGGGSAVGLSLRCASASARIELRASLASQGDRVSGSWEERSYNVSGGVSGIAAGSSLRLSISGGGLSGFMTVTTTGGSQSISVRTDSSGLKGVNISLRRN